MLTRTFFPVLFSLLFVISFISCGGNKLDSEDHNISQSPNGEGTYAGKVKIDLTAQPEIELDPNSETTKIILQFIPRNAENFPLTPEQVKVTLLLDDKKIDDEAHIENSSEQLAFNINFGLVLDASYSMLVSHGDEEAFTPMLQSAKNSVQKGIDIWSDQEGTFSFHTTWFNSAIYSSLDNATQQWRAEDLLSIPRPKSGAFTRLYSATDYAIEKMAESITENEQGPRDQNIILVFSDGEDNYSWHNDQDIPTTTDSTSNDADFVKLGYADTNLEDLVTTINNQDNLSVHVISLGTNINASNLQTIATAGKGLYLENPDARDLEKPFQQVIQEFTTLQSHGAIMPLQAGEYKFTLRVENALGRDAVEYSFLFKTGEGTAEIISTN